jgi:type II secretory pathway pseudopilin PulG
MKQQTGLGLVEIILSIAIFGLLSTVISSTIISSMKLRRESQQQLIAQQYAAEVLERHRDYWSIKTLYENQDFPGSDSRFTDSLSSKPEFVNSVIARYSCFDSNGTNRTSAALESGVTPTTINCTVVSPALRRITVTLTDTTGEALASLTTEIGRPAR